METKTMSFRDTIILAMSEEMRRDENVLLMGEDVGVFGGDFGTSVGMLEEFGPERVRDCPISEAAISGAAWMTDSIFTCGSWQKQRVLQKQNILTGLRHVSWNIFSAPS